MCQLDFVYCLFVLLFLFIIFPPICILKRTKASLLLFIIIIIWNYSSLLIIMMWQHVIISAFGFCLHTYLHLFLKWTRFTSNSIHSRKTSQAAWLLAVCPHSAIATAVLPWLHGTRAPHHSAVSCPMETKGRPLPLNKPGEQKFLQTLKCFAVTGEKWLSKAELRSKWDLCCTVRYIILFDLAHAFYK